MELFKEILSQWGRVMIVACEYPELFTGVLEDGKVLFPHQIPMATGKDKPMLIDGPSRVGKIISAVLGWLWRRGCFHVFS